MATEVESKRSKFNLIGLSKTDYKGGPTSLCQGCGHNSISSQIMAAMYENSIRPEKMIKLSGIGCSSKSPAYFLRRSHGFNSIHGRMPSVATGALLSNRDLHAIGVSGDGDTASIGIGQFLHMVRRNVPMVYIVENNGVYGLTKGQFSATADQGQVLRKIGVNTFMPLDICMEALGANCAFVARSFAGDAKQVKALIKAAMSFRGTAVLEIISPCVTFNNRDESTKSYAWGREHESPIHDVTYVQSREEISVDYEPGEVTSVIMHDGSTLVLKKLERDYDPTDRQQAIALLEEERMNENLITGLIYINTNTPSLIEAENIAAKPLTTLAPNELRPSANSLEEISKSFM